MIMATYTNGYPILVITSNIVQLFVMDNNDGELHVLSYYDASHQAIKDGNLVDANDLIEATQSVIKKTNFFLNTQIEKTVLIFPDTQASVVRNNIGISLQSEGTAITNKHIRQLFSETAKATKISKQMLLNIFPVDFSVNGVTNIENPKGLLGSNITMNSYAVTVSEGLLINVLHTLEQSGLQVMDVYPTFIGNMFEIMHTFNSREGGNIVDLGYNQLTLLIYKDGVPRKVRTLKFGVGHFVQVLASKYQITDEDALDLLENYVYFDEQQAEDVIVYRLELSSKTVDITEQDLIQTLSAYLEDMFASLKELLQYYEMYNIYPVFFTGYGTRLIGIDAFIHKYLDTFDTRFYKTQVVGLREHDVCAATGILRYLPQRDKLMDVNYKQVTIKPREEILDKRKKIHKSTEIKAESHPGKQRKLWDKIADYFFE